MTSFPDILGISDRKNPQFSPMSTRCRGWQKEEWKSTKIRCHFWYYITSEDLLFDE